MAENKEELAGTPIPVPSKESVRLTKFLKNNNLTKDDLKKLEIDPEMAKDYFTDEKVYQIKSDAEKKAKTLKRVALPMGLVGTAGALGSSAALSVAQHLGKDVKDLENVPVALGIVGGSSLIPATMAIRQELIADEPEKKAGEPLLKAYAEKLKEVANTKHKLKKSYYNHVDVGNSIRTPRKVLRSKKDVDDYLDSLSYSELLSLSRTLNGEPM